MSKGKKSRKKSNGGYHSKMVTRQNITNGLIRTIMDNKRVSVDQLQKVEQTAYERAYRKAMFECAEMTSKQLYCAAALAAKQEFGFGPQRALRLIKAMDKKYIECIYSDELVQEVEKQLGLQLGFHQDLRKEDVEGTSVEDMWDQLTEMEL